MILNKKKRLAIDATNGDPGRLINHNLSSPNVAMKVVVKDRQPLVVFVTLREVAACQEVLYDYGERQKTVLEDNPWLK